MKEKMYEEKTLFDDLEENTNESAGEKKENKIAPPETQAKRVRIEVNDECPRCGNPYESDGNCVECMKNKKKIAYLKEKNK